MTKLMGLSYKIIYKKGSENKVADAISRVSSTEHYDIFALSVVKQVWLQDIQAGYQQDHQALQLLTELSVQSPLGFYTLQDGLIKYKGRVWIGSNSTLQAKILFSLHNSVVGGHSSLEVTYHRIKAPFAWPKLKQLVKTFVS